MADYRFADAADTADIVALWRQVFFEDTETEIRRFLASADLANECLIATEDGRVVSMVFLLPAFLKADRPLPLQYIYAAATLPTHRGRGLFATLLKKALQVARERGEVASFLHPATPSLGDYYARFGYQPFFYCDILTGTAKPSPLSIQFCSVQEYEECRRRLQPPLSVIWPSRFLEHTVKVGDGCAVAVKNGAVLSIKELLCDVSQQTVYAQSLAAWFGCDTYECRVPTTAKTAAPFGLLCAVQPFDKKNMTVPYMGTALD